MSDFLYQELIAGLSTDFEPEGITAKRMTPKINALGPFECSTYEESDVIHMLGHLVCRRLVDVHIESSEIYGGNFVNKYFYRAATNSSACQLSLI